MVAVMRILGVKCIGVCGAMFLHIAIRSISKNSATFIAVMKLLTTYNRFMPPKSVCILGAMVLLSFLIEINFEHFPVSIFRFPLNILVVALWVAMLAMLYRDRTTNACARFMLSSMGTWVSFTMIVAMGIVLGLEREPSTTAWPMVFSLLFVQSQLLFIILRGWRNRQGIRWRFCLTHIGLLLALGAGFWGAPDREQLRAAVHHCPSNEAYTMEGAHRFLPYTVELKDFCIQQSASGAPTHYEAQLMVDGKVVTLKVNHPYARTLSEKIYLVSFSTSPHGERYAVIEIVNEPWQWVSATGILMLIAGALLLFIQGPRRKSISNNGKI